VLAVTPDPSPRAFPHPLTATQGVPGPSSRERGDRQPQRGSEGLKGLKGLNVSGAGEGGTFTVTGDDPHPSATTPRPKSTRHTVPGPVRRERENAERLVTGRAVLGAADRVELPELPELPGDQDAGRVNAARRCSC
jgi:hypothetical protein